VHLAGGRVRGVVPPKTDHDIARDVGNKGDRSESFFSMEGAASRTRTAMSALMKSSLIEEGIEEGDEDEDEDGETETLVSSPADEAKYGGRSPLRSPMSPKTSSKYAREAAIAEQKDDELLEDARVKLEDKRRKAVEARTAAAAARVAQVESDRKARADRRVLSVVMTPRVAEPLETKEVEIDPIDGGEYLGDYADDGLDIWPLHLVDFTDVEQFDMVYALLKKLPHIIHDYLANFILPDTTRHQGMKLTASGQALGGTLLFNRRLGFSGTPSDLLPIELGKCRYERGADAKMIHYLTAPAVMSHSFVRGDWTVDKVLKALASAYPPFHALIDTGALVTGKTNLEVASFLLTHGLQGMDGVVFLDGDDRKMMLTRATMRVTHLEHSGIPLQRRFTFYDQIHTTGMDIKQPLKATAAVTLGKDMTFRDYAQGAFRMRGIGIGQRIHVIATPEICGRVAESLAPVSHGEFTISPLWNDAMRGKLELPYARSGGARGGVGGGVGGGVSGRGDDDESDDDEGALISSLESPTKTVQVYRDIVAWLVLNGMRSEKIQFNMLSEQCVRNVSRKNAFQQLLAEHATVGRKDVDARTQSSIDMFRERMDYSVDNCLPKVVPFSQKLDGIVHEFQEFIVTSDDMFTITEIRNKVTKSSTADTALMAAHAKSMREQGGTGGSAARGDEKAEVIIGFSAEQVQEQEEEQEQEQEQEQEVEVMEEEEPEDMRDEAAKKKYNTDPQVTVPFRVDALAKPGSHVRPSLSTGFYLAAEFNVFQGLRSGEEPLHFPKSMLMSSNYYHRKWQLMGARRIKNVIVLMEWIPDTTKLETMVGCDHGCVLESVTHGGTGNNDRRVSVTRKGGNDGEDDTPSMPRKRTVANETAPPPTIVGMPAPGGGGGDAAAVTPGDGSADDEDAAEIAKQKALLAAALEYPPDVPGELSAAQKQHITNAYNRFDVDGVGSVSAVQLRDILEVIGQDVSLKRDWRPYFRAVARDRRARLTDDTFDGDDEMTAFVGGFKDDDDDFDDDAVISDIRLTLDDILGYLAADAFAETEKGRYFVALSLEEAEAVRGLIHLRNARREPLVAGYPNAAIALRIGKMTLDSSVGFKRAPRFQVMTARKCFRFLNSDAVYESDQLGVVLKGLQHDTPAQRLAFFNEVRSCRRRVQNDVLKTTLAQVFNMKDHYHYLEYRSTITSIRWLIRNKGMDVLDAFRAFDWDRDGNLSCSELYGGLQWLGLSQLTPQDIYDIMRDVDRTKTGRLNFVDFALAFRPPVNDVPIDVRGSSYGSGGGAQLNAAYSKGSGLGANNDIVSDDFDAPVRGDGDDAEAPVAVITTGLSTGYERVLVSPIPIKELYVPKDTDKVKESLYRQATETVEHIPMEVLASLQVSVKQVWKYRHVWCSQGSLSRSPVVSIWRPSTGKTYFKERNNYKIILGQYVQAGTEANEPAQFSMIELTDLKTSSMFRSENLTNAHINKLLPHPIKFRLVWSQLGQMQSGGRSIYCWKALPPSSAYVALGMVSTTTPDEPPLISIRCVPAKWLQPTTFAPIKLWDDSGATGKAGSFWQTNPHGLVTFVEGHAPPAGEQFEFISNNFRASTGITDAGADGAAKKQ
jgi:Ca2+-binding EF-hand superfamily protein